MRSKKRMFTTHPINQELVVLIAGDPTQRAALLAIRTQEIGHMPAYLKAELLVGLACTAGGQGTLGTDSTQIIRISPTV